MATYKVLQDIEAEDKLVGPFSLRQFIYAAIVIVLGFISFKLLTVNFLLIIPFVPPMIFFGLLAAPIGTEQSSEIWLLAKIKFLTKPHKRVWNQSGIEQLVTITAPPKVVRQLTDNLSQGEVKSRLKALATTLDSRGWAVKGEDLNLPIQGSHFYSQDNVSDRLVGSRATLPKSSLANDISAEDDIMDEKTNPLAQNLDMMIKKSGAVHRKGLITKIKEHSTDRGLEPIPDYDSIVQPPIFVPLRKNAGDKRHESDEVLPGETAKKHRHRASGQNKDEEAFLKQRAEKDKGFKTSLKHLRNIKGGSSEEPAELDISHVTDTERVEDKIKHNPDILRLAGNDDLNISTIAHEAHKSTGDLSDDEVYIPLH